MGWRPRRSSRSEWRGLCTGCTAHSMGHKRTLMGETGYRSVCIPTFIGAACHVHASACPARRHSEDRRLIPNRLYVSAQNGTISGSGVRHHLRKSPRYEIEMDTAFVNGIKDNEVSSCQNTLIDRPTVDNIHFPLFLTIL